MSSPAPKELESAFTEKERKVLHSLAETFEDKDDRDQLRNLVQDGVTLREIILAYKTQRRMVSSLKTVGGLIVLLGGVAAVFKSAGFWPK